MTTYKRVTPDMIELDADEAHLLEQALRGKRIVWDAARQQPLPLVLATLRHGGCLTYRNGVAVTGFGYRVLRHHRAGAAARDLKALRTHAATLKARLDLSPTTDANLALDAALSAYLETTT